MKKKITIKDVAAQAGVSHQLVSSVLSGKKSTIRYSEKTKKRVEEAAQRLGFSHCILARSFKANRSFLVGVLIGHGANHLLRGFLQGIQDILVPHGITPLFLGSSSAAEEAADLQILRQRQVDGVIAFSYGQQPEIYAELMQEGKPVVEISAVQMQKEGAVSVLRDMEGIGYESARHLLGLGHRDIALVTHGLYDNPKHWDAGNHWRGYVRAMKEAGLKPRVLTHSLERYQLGNPYSFFHCAQEAELVAQVVGKGRPSALVCYTSMQALALMKEAEARGLRVPQDISFMGSESHKAAQLFTPQLTVIGSAPDKMGRIAASLVLAQLRGEQVEKTTLIAPELFPGGSVAALRS